MTTDEFWTVVNEASLTTVQNSEVEVRADIKYSEHMLYVTINLRWMMDRLDMNEKLTSRHFRAEQLLR